MNLLLPHTGTVIWMMIAFLTVFFILKKYAWKPVLNALKQRDLSIEESLLSAETAKKEIAKLKSDNAAILLEARLEREKIIKEARALKDEIINDAKDQATSESERILENARISIKSEKESAIKEIKDHVASLSVFIAEKLLQEKLADTKEQQELIDKLFKNAKLELRN
jgi:F-type H+-transporting ATPase subunit b